MFVAFSISIAVILISPGSSDGGEIEKHAQGKYLPKKKKKKTQTEGKECLIKTDWVRFSRK